MITNQLLYQLSYAGFGLAANQRLVAAVIFDGKEMVPPRGLEPRTN